MPMFRRNKSSKIAIVQPEPITPKHECRNCFNIIDTFGIMECNHIHCFKCILEKIVDCNLEKSQDGLTNEIFICDYCGIATKLDKQIQDRLLQYEKKLKRKAHQQREKRLRSSDEDSKISSSNVKSTDSSRDFNISPEKNEKSCKSEKKNKYSKPEIVTMDFSPETPSNPNLPSEQEVCFKKSHFESESMDVDNYGEDDKSPDSYDSQGIQEKLGGLKFPSLGKSTDFFKGGRRMSEKEVPENSSDSRKDSDPKLQYTSNDSNDGSRKSSIKLHISNQVNIQSHIKHEKNHDSRNLPKLKYCNNTDEMEDSNSHDDQSEYIKEVPSDQECTPSNNSSFMKRFSNRSGGVSLTNDTNNILNRENSGNVPSHFKNYYPRIQIVGETEQEIESSYDHIGTVAQQQCLKEVMNNDESMCFANYSEQNQTFPPLEFNGQVMKSMTNLEAMCEERTPMDEISELGIVNFDSFDLRGMYVQDDEYCENSMILRSSTFEQSLLKFDMKKSNSQFFHKPHDIDTENYGENHSGYHNSSNILKESKKSSNENSNDNVRASPSPMNSTKSSPNSKGINQSQQKTNTHQLTGVYKDISTTPLPIIPEDSYKFPKNFFSINSSNKIEKDKQIPDNDMGNIEQNDRITKLLKDVKEPEKKVSSDSMNPDDIKMKELIDRKLFLKCQIEKRELEEKKIDSERTIELSQRSLKDEFEKKDRNSDKKLIKRSNTDNTDTVKQSLNNDNTNNNIDVKVPNIEYFENNLRTIFKHNAADMKSVNFTLSPSHTNNHTGLNTKKQTPIKKWVDPDNINEEISPIKTGNQEKIQLTLHSHKNSIDSKQEFAEKTQSVPVLNNQNQFVETHENIKQLENKEQNEIFQHNFMQGANKPKPIEKDDLDLDGSPDNNNPKINFDKKFINDLNQNIISSSNSKMNQAHSEKIIMHSMFQSSVIASKQQHQKQESSDGELSASPKRNISTEVPIVMLERISEKKKEIFRKNTISEKRFNMEINVESNLNLDEVGKGLQADQNLVENPMVTDMEESSNDKYKRETGINSFNNDISKLSLEGIKDNLNHCQPKQSSVNNDIEINSIQELKKNDYLCDNGNNLLRENLPFENREIIEMVLETNQKSTQKLNSRVDLSPVSIRRSNQSEWNSNGGGRIVKNTGGSNKEISGKFFSEKNLKKETYPSPRKRINSYNLIEYPVKLEQEIEKNLIESDVISCENPFKDPKIKIVENFDVEYCSSIEPGNFIHEDQNQETQSQIEKEKELNRDRQIQRQEELNRQQEIDQLKQLEKQKYLQKIKDNTQKNIDNESIKVYQKDNRPKQPDVNDLLNDSVPAIKSPPPQPIKLGIDSDPETKLNMRKKYIFDEHCNSGSYNDLNQPEPVSCEKIPFINVYDEITHDIDALAISKNRNIRKIINQIDKCITDKQEDDKYYSDFLDSTTKRKNDMFKSINDLTASIVAFWNVERKHLIDSIEEVFKANANNIMDKKKVVDTKLADLRKMKRNIIDDEKIDRDMNQINKLYNHLEKDLSNSLNKFDIRASEQCEPGNKFTIENYTIFENRIENLRKLFARLEDSSSSESVSMTKTNSDNDDTSANRNSSINDLTDVISKDKDTKSQAYEAKTNLKKFFQNSQLQQLKGSNKKPNNKISLLDKSNIRRTPSFHLEDYNSRKTLPPKDCLTLKSDNNDNQQKRNRSKNRPQYFENTQNPGKVFNESFSPYNEKDKNNLFSFGTSNKKFYGSGSKDHKRDIYRSMDDRMIQELDKNNVFIINYGLRNPSEEVINNKQEANIIGRSNNPENNSSSSGAKDNSAMLLYKQQKKLKNRKSQNDIVRVGKTDMSSGGIPIGNVTIDKNFGGSHQNFEQIGNRNALSPDNTKIFSKEKSRSKPRTLGLDKALIIPESSLINTIETSLKSGNKGNENEAIPFRTYSTLTNQTKQDQPMSVIKNDQNCLIKTPGNKLRKIDGFQTLSKEPAKRGNLFKEMQYQQLATKKKFDDVSKPNMSKNIENANNEKNALSGFTSKIMKKIDDGFSNRFNLNEQMIDCGNIGKMPEPQQNNFKKKKDKPLHIVQAAPGYKRSGSINIGKEVAGQIVKGKVPPVISLGSGWAQYDNKFINMKQLGDVKKLMKANSDNF